MQFPYPRQSSRATAFPSSRNSSLSFAQRRRLRSLTLYGLFAFTFIFILLRLFGGSSSTPAIPEGTPEVVIVTPLDKSLDEELRRSVEQNRRDYATRHGYAVFFPNTTDYDLMPEVPKTWSKVPAIRHALALYPHSTWAWYLSSTAFIMDPREPLSSKVLQPRKLESLMIVDRPVVPPDSVIRTFSHLRGERVDFVLAQDREGLAGDSFFIRNGDWAKFFLDAWFDPLYRSYNFQKSEHHALEHLVQWHGTILAKLALVPQKIINSYTDSNQREDGMSCSLLWGGLSHMLTDIWQASTPRVTSWQTHMGVCSRSSATARSS